MTPGSVFPTLSLDRQEVRWEDHLTALTPVTQGESGRWYKREDHFAPLGYGGINGSKLRQLIHLVHAYRQEGGVAGLLTGASVLSPQVSMAALVARHYQLSATIVLGATGPDTCGRHENVAIAQAAGATLRFVPVGFNPALQRAVATLARQPEYQAHYRLHYGITTPTAATPTQLAGFHLVGAHQVHNVPDDVQVLVMTLGSGNTATSVLLGIALQRPAALRRVVLLGVGPSRLDWTLDRLDRLGGHLGLDVAGCFGPGGPVALEVHDLHAEGFARYHQRMPYQVDGITLHPTYEGKALAYLDRHRDRFGWWWHATGEVLFWIVGSEPSRQAMAGVLR
jgi:Pyridoxal-phosphate dependent enzyme